MKQHNYSSYDEYVENQKAAYFNKIDKRWVKKETIKFISEILLSKIDIVGKGICHGSKRGHEVKWFRKFLKCDDIIGTEIAESRNQYIIQWDFQHIKPEWLNSMDFIYSNSLDHAYDPKVCVNNWCSCLKDNGFLILEHSLQHKKPTEVDPFGISYNDLVDIIPEWTNGKFNVSFVVEPEKQYRNRKSKILFIKKRG